MGAGGGVQHIGGSKGGGGPGGAWPPKGLTKIGLMAQFPAFCTIPTLLGPTTLKTAHAKGSTFIDNRRNIVSNCGPLVKQQIFYFSANQFVKEATHVIW